MKEITISQGYHTLVDDADFVWLNQWKWSADVRSHTVYVVRRDRDEEGFFPVLMHRQIMGFPDLTVDHRDRNGLNNQRSNLRVATLTQQQANKRGHGVSGIKGVSFHQGKWRAIISVNKVQRQLGRFDTIEEATTAYAQAIRELHGEFAYTTEEEQKEAD